MEETDTNQSTDTTDEQGSAESAGAQGSAEEKMRKEPIKLTEPDNKLKGVLDSGKKFLDKPCKMIMPTAIVAVGILVGLSAMYLNPSIFAGNNGSDGAQNLLTIEEARTRAIEFINGNMLQNGITASITESAEESGLYRIKLKIQEEEFDSYMTKDGRFLFPQFIDIEEIAKEKEITKADRPDVKVFVMSYCPYGLQAQKMFLPVYNLLKDEADISVYYVDYIMHDKQEIDENLRQYCIGLEQNDKYYDYLNCFVYGDTADSAKCMASAGIDKTKLIACVAKVDKEFSVTERYNDKTTWVNEQFPEFGLHTDLNKEYDVKGSPTIIINGKAMEVSPRSPENFKSIVCESFNVTPEKCSETLSDEVPSPGFGGGVGNSSGGQCK